MIISKSNWRDILLNSMVWSGVMTTKENPEIPKDDDIWRIYLEHFKTMNNNRHQLVEGYLLQHQLYWIWTLAEFDWMAKYYIYIYIYKEIVCLET